MRACRPRGLDLRECCARTRCMISHGPLTGPHATLSLHSAQRSHHTPQTCSLATISTVCRNVRQMYYIQLFTFLKVINPLNSKSSVSFCMFSLCLALFVLCFIRSFHTQYTVLSSGLVVQETTIGTLSPTCLLLACMCFLIDISSIHINAIVLLYAFVYVVPS